MGQVEKMLRVGKSRPCPVCGKPDWCLKAKDDSAAICARIEDGSKKRCGEAGWLHILSRKPFDRKRQLVFRREIPLPVHINKRLTALCAVYRKNLSIRRLHAFSDRLGLTAGSLLRLGTGWDGKDYTFPMFNAKGQIIGVRLRSPNGGKFCVTGSKTRLFIPDGLSNTGVILLCEGPTDTAASLDLGYDAIGRPNCNSGHAFVKQFVKARPVVIVADNDYVGNQGAKSLACDLLLDCPSVKIIYPPDGHRDLRSWLMAGLTTEALQEHIEQSPLMKAVIQHG